VFYNPWRRYRTALQPTPCTALKSFFCYEGVQVLVHSAGGMMPHLCQLSWMVCAVTPAVQWRGIRRRVSQTATASHLLFGVTVGAVTFPRRLHVHHGVSLRTQHAPERFNDALVHWLDVRRKIRRKEHDVDVGEMEAA
jgi:hypothetical protein